MAPFGWRRLSLVSAALLYVAGCSSTGWYFYRPEENVTAELSGQPAARYTVPPLSSHGEVSLASMGITTLERRGEGGERVQAVHVRMVVENRDDAAPWQVDTRQQIFTLDVRNSRPAFVSASSGQPPLLSIPPHTTEVIDLYYALPQSMQTASTIPRFEILWYVQTPQALALDRTTFARMHAVPPPARAYSTLLLGSGRPG
jgi:hypothetical protein